MNKTIEKLIALRILSEKINPTLIYCEGWMIRLLVIESMVEKLKINGIDFEVLATKNWSSEALITSPFVKAKVNRESYTHADIILGDFNVNYDERAEAIPDHSPKILGIIEAKMGSGLSQRTTKAKDYNQASRSICCLSYVTRDYPDCEIFFAVAAPKKTIKKHEIEKQIQQETIRNQIKSRFPHSNEEYPAKIQAQVEKCKIVSVGYEDWIERIRDSEVKKALDDFYSKCMFHNKVKSV